MKQDEIKQYADYTHERVSSWIDNCDSKASIILALLGVILSIAFTSDFILDGIVEQVKDIVNLCRGCFMPNGFVSIICIIILIISIVFFIISFKNLINVIYARLDNSKSEDNPSISFYGSIGSSSYDDYKKLVKGIKDGNIIDDKLRQVHICSKICLRKFTLYNKGICSLKIGLVLFAIFFVVLIIKSSV